MNLIKTFKQVSKKDTLIAGGKGASLGEMTQAGISVPEGFVILSNSFDKFIEETDLNVEIDAVFDEINIKEVHSVENASEKIQAIILSKEMPDDIKSKILEFYKKLDCKFVAVRSSATSEDSASAAWAGQLDSFLNTTKETLLENVKKCWASLFTPRAIFYRFEKKLNKDKISVAVVVQKMVDSEESGIAFSVHPVTQDENQIIIEAGFGLGEAIVSGSITPDSYVVDKQGFSILDINVNEQTKALYKKAKGGNEWKELGEKGKKQVLTEEEIIELSKIIIKIENYYGFPCDIEWAKEKGNFYIVQSRPITTLTKEKNVASQLKDFIYQPVCIPIFVRPYSFTEILALYDAYMYKYKEETGDSISNVLVFHYQDKQESFYQFFVDFADYNSRIQNKINQEEGFKLLHGGINKYYKKVEHYKSILKKIKSLNKKDKEDVFNLASKILAFESILFILPYLHHDLNMPIKDEELLEKGIKARLDTEDFFTPKTGFLDKTLDKVDYIPPYFSLENNEDTSSLLKKEFIIFNNKIITDKNILNIFKDLKKSKFEATPQDSKEIKGTTAFEGLIKSKVKIILSKEDFHKMEEGDIIVAHGTTPDYMPLIRKSGGIIAEEGGFLSHAAIVSRELKIPCIMGAFNATKILKDNDKVELNAYTGVIKILK